MRSMNAVLLHADDISNLDMDWRTKSIIRVDRNDNQQPALTLLVELLALSCYEFQPLKSPSTAAKGLIEGTVSSDQIRFTSTAGTI